MKHIILIVVCLLIMAGQAQATEYNFTYEAPTANEDGTPLKDLGGYNLYEDGLKVKDCLNSLSCTYDVPEGSHVYAVRAYDTSGNESKDSNPLTLDITICPDPVTNFKATKAK